MRGHKNKINFASLKVCCFEVLVRIPLNLEGKETKDRGQRLKRESWTQKCPKKWLGISEAHVEETRSLCRMHRSGVWELGACVRLCAYDPVLCWGFKEALH